MIIVLSFLVSLLPKLVFVRAVSCSGVRYARIDAGANYLQISQLAVYTDSGSNAALGKSTSASSVYTGDTCAYYASGGVDGVLVAKLFHSCGYTAYLSLTSSGAYWQVDLGSSQTITSVVYYNRGDTGDNVRAATYALTLLDAANGLVCSCRTFTTSLIQDLTLIGASQSPTARPSLKPSAKPTVIPSVVPSVSPTIQPTLSPTRLPSLQPTALPSINPTSTPTRLSCSGVRYARIDAGANYLQISQLAVYNTSGSNVALGKSISATAAFVNDVCPYYSSAPVDGVLVAKVFSNCSYKVYYSSIGTGAYWQVDLGSSQTISRVVYYNRGDNGMTRALTYSLTLLNAASGLVCSTSTFTSDLIQDLTLIPVPTAIPTVMPTVIPTITPSVIPTTDPSSSPTNSPSSTPTVSPSVSPSTIPSAGPTTDPSSSPTNSPSSTPTVSPSVSPSTIPSAGPTTDPSSLPTTSPSSTPTVSPSVSPSTIPSAEPTTVPSSLPTTTPSSTPTVSPSVSPSTIPSTEPTTVPSSLPSASPSTSPSVSPSVSPSTIPSAGPTTDPSSLPTTSPSSTPTVSPSVSPSTIPSAGPTTVPSSLPTTTPSLTPTTSPSVSPSTIPSAGPTTVPSSLPSASPSSTPTVSPSVSPSTIPSAGPTTDPSSLPTTTPSSSPTVSPSVSPSTIPSAGPTTVPSSLPTASPSSTPTVSPSVSPSTIPSAGPTTVPSSLPTTTPSSTPTVSPSVSPSSIPSAEPTTVPSSLPTTTPSSTPTVSPSVSPSTIPSAGPTTVPSSLPTTTPSSTPTVSPSVSPSTIPSAGPTTDPSSLPSASPSSTPTVSPSVPPSTIPSTEPTTVPSLSPTTFSPTFNPSFNPTSSPTTRPTIIPTRMPTTKPSLQPVTVSPTTTPVLPPTTLPTLRGDTNPPTVTPSSPPTWNLWDYQTKRIYKSEYHPLVNRTTIAVDTKKIFSSFTYKGYVKEGECINWKTFASNSLNLVVNTYYFSDIKATFGYENFHTFQYTNVTAICSTESIVSGIVTTIQSKTITSTYPDYTASCSGNLWRVFTCDDAPVLCVNCSDDCSCPSLSTYLTSSCYSSRSSSSCQSNSASYSYLIFSMKQRVLYPKLTILAILNDRTNIDIVANISSSGRLYCLAVIENTTLSSAYHVKQYGSSSVVFDYTKNITLTLTSLSPSTSYSIYCYTEDSGGNGMDLNAVKATRRSVTTNCCPTIAFTTTYTSIVEYYSNFTAADSSVFSFTLEKIPKSTQIVKLMVYRVACGSGISYDTNSNGDSSSSSNNVSASEAVAYPSTFVFVGGSLVLSNSFVVHGTPGCYEIIASGHGLHNATLSLFIYNTSTVVAPSIKSAYFSADGSSVYIAFDSSTNYGKIKIANYASGFPCSELFLFTGSSSFICKWLSNKLIYAYLADVVAMTPSVGDPVLLISGILSPNCVHKVCSAATTAGAAVTLSTSPSLINPTAAISAPALISSCSDIILDPTASIGQGLKDWSTVQWYVSSSDFDTSLIDSYLNNYHNSTAKAITISNSYLTIGTITFTLYLTNFLGLSSITTATVEISSSSDIPYTTISGSSTVSLYRWQSLSLFASSTVSSCSGTISFTNNTSSTTSTSSHALTYSWKVYQGLTYQSSLTSTSLDPRYFKLPAYSLNTLSQYTVQVTTTSVSTGSFASASVTIYVKQSGAIAIISGGAKRVVSTYLPLVLNANSSYDKDTGSGTSLTYSWSCFVLSPVFGDPCGLTLGSTSAITIPAFTLSAKTYNFTVVAVSETGTTGTTSVTIIGINEELASVHFNSLKAKYNPEDRFIISTSITATDSLKTDWSCPGCGLNLSDIALTPLTLYFRKGTLTVGLSLSMSSFVSGLSYTLQLSCTYYNRSQPVTSYSQALITMNAPPVQGLLTVAPGIGYALATSFYLNTYGWVDDASDYPISYTLTYYNKDSSSSSLIKSLGTVQYAYAYIGQGLSVRNYTVTCVATASDIYDCSNSVDTIIQVFPPTSTTSLQRNMIQQLSLASVTSNPDLTIQTSAAATSYLNAASCSAAPDCTSLNRSDCDTIKNTCGPCLSGYLGVSGYANSGCQLPSSLRVTGSACSANSDCVSNNCQSNLCTLSLRTCSNNCSGNGICQYYDSNSNIITSCDANSVFCKAKCHCHENIFGSDCSLTLSDYELRLSMRERMCVSLYTLLDSQDVTSDVITGRASLLSSLLLDVTQLTTYALSNCTLALTTTVLQYPSVSVEDSVYEYAIAALSTVAEYGQSLTLILSTQVSTAIDTLLENRQLVLGINEVSSAVSTNLRLTSTVSYKSDVITQSYSLPQSDLETFTHVLPAQVQIGSTANDDAAIVRVSLSQSNINYRNDTTDASIVKLQVYYDSATAKTSANIYSQNYHKMEYTSSAAYNTTVYCTTASTPYNISANCSNDPSLMVYCPGTSTRTVTAVCPAWRLLPQCLSWNGVKYYQDPSCQRVTYSPTNTSCECSGSTSYVSRRQLDASTDVNRMAGEFSASAMIEVQAFVSTWSSAADLSASSITDNYYIVLTVSLIAGFFIIGFFNITCKNYFFPEQQEEVSKKESEVDRLTLSNAKAFFDSILPVEFKFRPWYSNFWIKLLECHPHLAYFAPARGRRLYHTKKWLCFCFEVLFFIFMDSIFSPLANADDSTCAAYVTESTCIQPISFDLISSVCVWDSENEECLYNPPDNSFTVTIMVVLVASLCSQPASALAEFLIDKATARTEEEEEESHRNEGKERENIESRNDHSPSQSNSLESPEGNMTQVVRYNKVVPFKNTIDTMEYRLPTHVSMNSRSSPLPDNELGRLKKKNRDLAILSQANNLVVEDFEDQTSVKNDNDPDIGTTTLTAYDEEPRKVSITILKETLKSKSNERNNSQRSPLPLPAPPVVVVVRVVPDSHISNLHSQSFVHAAADILAINNNDSEITLMTLPSLMMLAARLSLLQQRLDSSSPEEELEWLLRGSNELYETDIIAEASTMMSFLRTMSGMKSLAADQRTVEMNKIHSKMLHKIVNVRARTEKVVGDLKEMETDEMKEKYLVKKFIVELKKGVYKKVIFRHFFELEEEEEEGDTVHWLIRILSIVGLFALAFGSLFYILLTGISLGQSTTILWLEVLAIGLVQDIFLLKPLGIWFRFIAIASIVSDSVRHVTNLIHERVHLILRRTKGVVRHNSLLVQHFNAACRAARAFPHLQTSRLLIALNDYDLPKTKPHKRRLLKLFLDMLFLFFVLIILLLTLMPEVFQETIIEASMTVLINFPIYVLLLLANWNIALPVMIVVIVIICIVVREYILFRRRQVSMQRNTKA